MGMGETPDDLIDMAFALREMNVESIPLNFLNSIDGTPSRESIISHLVTAYGDSQ